MTAHRQVALALVTLDALAVFVTFNIVAWAYLGGQRGDLLTLELIVPIAIHFLAVYLIDGYNPRTDMMSVNYTSLHTISLMAVVLLSLLVIHAVIPAGFALQTSRFVTTFSYLLLIPVTLSYRRAFYAWLLTRQQQRYFLFVGSPESCAAFREECRRNRMKQEVLYATVDTLMSGVSPAGQSAPPVGNAVHYLAEYEHQLDAIILRETNRELPPAVAQKLVALHFSGVPTYTLELFHEVYWRKIPLYRLNQTWLFQEGFQIAREPVFARLKRVSDVVLSLLGLLVFLPLLPLAALAIWLTDRGPVFFRQPRVGKNHAVYTAFKLRTMRVQTGDGDLYTRANDDRVTAIGRFLRASRLDEVPQIWNVLTGDMSLIGPRAEWTKLVEQYEKEIPCYHFRHLVKPGITGWAQVNYPYGASLDDTLRKLEYDLYYIRYFSFALDAAIVLKTIHVMLFGKGR